MKNKLLPLLFYVILFTLTSCIKTTEDPEVTSTLDVKYAPELENTIYPSLIFGLSEIEKQQNESANYFTITVNPTAETDIKIVIEESKLNYETIIVEKNVKGTKEIYPSLKWKYDDLKNLSQPGTVDLTFICYSSNDKELGRKNMKLSYRSINECVIYLQSDGEPLDLKFMLAAYVNEDSPVIDQFLKTVLDNTELSSFSGYQIGEDEVFTQVEAVFYTLRNMGVKYSSITSTSNTNKNLSSQYIRFSDEVLNNTQANCADGTVFFCSVLQKVGIHSIMIFVPGHVYLGYYLDKEKTKLRLLETTTVGNSTYDFYDATNYQVDEYNTDLTKFNDEDSFNYFVLDVGKARQIIKPIGR